jgi:transketolase
VTVAWKEIGQKKKQLKDTRKELETTNSDLNQLIVQEDMDSEERYEAWLARDKEVERPRKGSLEKLREPIDGETKEEYKTRQTEVDRQQKPYIENMKVEFEDRVKIATDQKGNLITRVEQTDRDLSNTLHEFCTAQAKRAKTKAWLERLDKEERELVRPQADLTPSHLTLSRMGE